MRGERGGEREREGEGGGERGERGGEGERGGREDVYVWVDGCAVGERKGGLTGESR